MVALTIALMTALAIGIRVVARYLTGRLQPTTEAQKKVDDSYRANGL